MPDDPSRPTPKRRRRVAVPAAPERRVPAAANPPVVTTFQAATATQISPHILAMIAGRAAAAGTLDTNVAATGFVHQLAGQDPRAGAAARRPILRPDARLQIELLDRFTAGAPRERMTVPVSPAATVTDALLFEAPTDPARKYYLPRYELAGRPGEPGKVRLRLEADAGNGPRLLLHLLPSRPPETGTAAAEELDHQLGVSLTVRQGEAGAAVRTFAFTEITREEDGTVRAVLGLPMPLDLTLVFLGLTDASLGARLIVQRTVRVAVQVPQQPTIARPGAPPPRPAPSYRARQVALSHEVSPRPFVFPPAIHADAFRGITGARGEPGLVRRSLFWGGRTHNYYQDNLDRELFYYLPDRFQIARAPAPPYRPQISVRFETASGSLDDSFGVLDFVAVPVTEPQRLAEAAGELERFLSAPQAGAPERRAPRFQPLQAGPGAVRLRLGLPGPIAFQERTGARIDLDDSIADTVTLPLSDFQSLFDALFGGSTALFTGEVAVSLGEGQDEIVPFVGRLDALAGEVFDVLQQSDAATGAVRATLRNAIESPVAVDRLTAALVQDGKALPASLFVRGLGEEPLAPGAEIAVEVVPAEPLPGDGPVHAVFDLTGVRVLPDREAIWALVLDPTTSAEYRRTITIKSFPALFEPPPERPDEQIVAVVVDFERGESVDLGADTLQATTELRLPLADYVLRRVDEGAYRYRLTVIRLDGQTRDADWRTDRTGILFPDVRR